MIGRPGILQRPPSGDSASRPSAMSQSPARTPTTPRLRKASSSFTDVAKKAADVLAGSTSEEDRVPVYNSIYEFLRFADSSSASSLWQALPTPVLIGLLTDDIIAGTTVVATATCNVFSHLSRHAAIIKSFPDAAELLVEMCRGVLRRGEKPLYALCLSCIANQKIADNLLEAKLSTLLPLWEELMRTSASPSVVTIMEGLNALQRLQTDFPSSMDASLLQWICAIYPLLGNTSSKVRSKVLALMTANKPQLKALSGKFLVKFAPDFKKTLNTELLSLMSSAEEVYVLQAWSLIVELLGKALHQGPFINETLKVAQQAFRKQSAADVQVAAFSAWSSLIANFKTDHNVLAVPKRLALILKPLQSNIGALPVPAVDAARARCWWSLVSALGDRVLSHYTEVCVPLLEFCVVPIVIPNQSSIITSSPANAPCQFLRQPILGCQMLANLFETPLPANSGADLIDTLPHIKLTQDMLVSSLPFLVQCVCSLATCCTEKPGQPIAISTSAKVVQEVVPSSWLQAILVVLGNRLKDLANVASDSGASANHMNALHQVLEDFLACTHSLLQAEPVPAIPLRLLLQTVLSLPESVILAGKFVRSLVIESSLEQPQSRLVPVITFLTETWFQLPLLTRNIQSERYIIMFERLISVGLQSGDPLGFVESTMSLLNTTYSELRAVTELPWRLWSVLANRLHTYIVQTQNVVQGSRLAPHFTAVHQALLFAANRLLQLGLSQITQRDLVKTWVDLYRAFTTAAALNEDTESNEWLCGLCDEIATESRSMTGMFSLTQLVDAVVECADFTEVKAVKNVSSSPFKQFPAEHQSALGYLLPLIRLLQRLAEVAFEGLGGRVSATLQFGAVSNSTSSSAGPVATQLMSTLSRVFAQLTSARQIKTILQELSASIALYLVAIDTKQRNGSVSFPSGFLPRLEKLTTSLLTCVQSRYNQTFDTPLLLAMSPILSSSIDHSNRAIRTRSLIFWNATFATAAHLDYPPLLRTTLAVVKKTTPLVLPGWLDEDGIASVPVPQGNTQETESQDMLILRKDVTASPKKTWGSFLGRTNNGLPSSPSKSPFMKSVLASPSRSPSQLRSPATRSARRRLPLSFDDESKKTSFVRIEPVKDKKAAAALTEHQKEMKERKSELPALYSLVDQSQESSTTKFAALKRRATADSPPQSKRLCPDRDAENVPPLPFLVDEDTMFELPMRASPPASLLESPESSCNADRRVSISGISTMTAMTNDSRQMVTSTESSMQEDPRPSGTNNGKTATPDDVSATKMDSAACQADVPTIPYDSSSQSARVVVDVSEVPTMNYITSSLDEAQRGVMDELITGVFQPISTSSNMSPPGNTNPFAQVASLFSFNSKSGACPPEPRQQQQQQQQQQEHTQQTLSLPGPSSTTVTPSHSPTLLQTDVSPISCPGSDMPDDGTTCVSAEATATDFTDASMGLRSLFTSTPLKANATSLLLAANESNRTSRDLSSLLKEPNSPVLKTSASTMQLPSSSGILAAGNDIIPPRLENGLSGKSDCNIAMDTGDSGTTGGGLSLNLNNDESERSSLICRRSSTRTLRAKRGLLTPTSPLAIASVSGKRGSNLAPDDLIGGKLGKDSSMVLHVTTPDASTVFSLTDATGSTVPPPPLTTEQGVSSSPPPDTHASCVRNHPDSASECDASGSSRAASPVKPGATKRRRGRSRRVQPASAAESNASACSQPDAVDSSGEGGVSVSAPPVKKRRIGRPRRNPVTEGPMTEKATAATGAATEEANAIVLSTPSKSVPTRQHATRQASRLVVLSCTPVKSTSTTATSIPETQSQSSQEVEHQFETPSVADFAKVSAFQTRVSISASPTFRQHRFTVSPGSRGKSDPMAAAMMTDADAVQESLSLQTSPHDTSEIVRGDLFGFADSQHPANNADQQPVNRQDSGEKDTPSSDAADVQPSKDTAAAVDVVGPNGAGSGDAQSSVTVVLCNGQPSSSSSSDIPDAVSPASASPAVQQGSGDMLRPSDLPTSAQVLTPRVDTTPSGRSPSPSSILKTGPSSRSAASQRHVTFDLPEEMTSSPLDSPRRLVKRFGGRPPRRLDMKSSLLKQRGISIPDNALYPALVMSIDPVERILPALTSGGRSRGLLQLMNSRHIRSVGDLARLRPEEVLSLPIKSPKVKVLLQALEVFHVTRFSPGCTPKRQTVKRVPRRASSGEADSASQTSGDSQDSTGTGPLQEELDAICNSADSTCVLSADADSLDVSFAPDSLVSDCSTDMDECPLMSSCEIADSSRDMTMPRLVEKLCASQEEKEEAREVKMEETAALTAVDPDGQGADDTMTDTAGVIDAVAGETKEEEEAMDCSAPSNGDVDECLSHDQPKQDSSTPSVAGNNGGADLLAPVGAFADDNEMENTVSVSTGIAPSSGAPDAIDDSTVENPTDRVLSEPLEASGEALRVPVICAKDADGVVDQDSLPLVETTPVAVPAVVTPSVVLPGQPTDDLNVAGDVDSDHDIADDSDTTMIVDEIDSLIASSSQCTENGSEAEWEPCGNNAASLSNTEAGGSQLLALQSACNLDSQFDITSSVESQADGYMQASNDLSTQSSKASSMSKQQARADKPHDAPTSPSAPSIYSDAVEEQDDADVHNASMSSLESVPGDGQLWSHSMETFGQLTADELETWSPRQLCNMQVQLSQLIGRVAYALRGQSKSKRT